MYSIFKVSKLKRSIGLISLTGHATARGQIGHPLSPVVVASKRQSALQWLKVTQAERGAISSSSDLGSGERKEKSVGQTTNLSDDYCGPRGISMHVQRVAHLTSDLKVSG